MKKKNYVSPQIGVILVELETSIAVSGYIAPASNNPEVTDWEDGGTQSGDILIP